MIFPTLTIFATTLSLAISASLTTTESTVGITTTDRPVDVSSTPPSCSKTDADGGSLPNVIFPICKAALNPKSLRNMVIHGMACACDLGTWASPERDDYNYTVGFGGYKLHTRAENFNNARKICNEEGGHLAVIDSLAEERILLKLFKAARQIRGATNTDEALIGTHDLYNEGEWVTILGDSLYKSGYTNWSEEWGGQPDNGGGVQHCGALMRDGGMDDVNCNIPFAFFCEISAIQQAL